MICDVCGETIITPLFLNCLLHHACKRCLDPVLVLPDRRNTDGVWPKPVRPKKWQCPVCSMPKPSQASSDHGGLNTTATGSNDNVKGLDVEDDLAGCNDEAEELLAIATSGGKQHPQPHAAMFEEPSRAITFFPYASNRHGKQTRLTSLNLGQTGLQVLSNNRNGTSNEDQDRTPDEGDGKHGREAGKLSREIEDFVRIRSSRPIESQQARQNNSASIRKNLGEKCQKGEAMARLMMRPRATEGEVESSSSSSDDDLWDFSSGPISKLPWRFRTLESSSSESSASRGTPQNMKYGGNAPGLRRKCSLTDLREIPDCRKSEQLQEFAGNLIGEAWPWDTKGSRSTSFVADSFGDCTSTKNTLEKETGTKEDTGRLECSARNNKERTVSCEQSPTDGETADGQHKEVPFEEERSTSPSKYDRRGYTYQWVLNEADNRKCITSSSESESSDDNANTRVKLTGDIYDNLHDTAKMEGNTNLEEMDRKTFDCVGLPEPANFWNI